MSENFASDAAEEIMDYICTRMEGYPDIDCDSLFMELKIEDIIKKHFKNMCEDVHFDTRITITPIKGRIIEQAAIDAVSIAQKAEMPVVLVFNDKRILVDQTSKPREVVEQYWNPKQD